MRSLVFFFVAFWLFVLHAFIGVCIYKTDVLKRVDGRIHRFLSPQPEQAKEVIVEEQAKEVIVEEQTKEVIVEEPTSAVSREISVDSHSLQAKHRKRADSILDNDIFIYQFNIHLAWKHLLPQTPIVVIGDSFVRSLDVENISPRAVNFGVAGDNSAGMLYRMGKYRKIMPTFSSANIVVVAIGINNLAYGENSDFVLGKDIAKLLKQIHPLQTLILNGMFPVDENIRPNEFVGYNKRISRLNKEMRTLCKSTPNCRFVDVGRRMVDRNGNLSPRFHAVGDPIHLSALGKFIWIKELKEVIDSLPVDGNESLKEGLGDEQSQIQ